VAEVARPVIRAVLDTNVLVPPGLRRDLQNAAQEAAFTAIWSPWIIAELNRVLTWKWLERTATSSAARNVICDLSPANWQRCSMAATAMMEILLATFELVNPRPPFPETWDTLADVQDVPIWAAAVEGRAQYVVSNNRRDYPPRQEDGRHIYQGVEYLSGTDVLRRLTAT
jgi:predicted nucleic acid-binding protein